MTVIARAPGKLVVLGEYVVLAGGPALVMAVDRYCVASIAPSPDARCHLQISAATETETSFAPGAPSGAALVDAVTQRGAARSAAPWRATVDTRALYTRGRKLGLGSSAAALTAWAGAWSAHMGLPRPELRALVGQHRAWQSGAGSGVDVAASLLGGVLVYRLDASGVPEAGSVALPDGVGCVGVFPGRAASTPSLVGRFRAWRETHAAAAERKLERMRRTAEQGVAAARDDDAGGFLAAITSYAEELESLGVAIGTDIVTPEHRAIARVANAYGVAYKISGAGGGDIGVGFSSAREDLDAFATEVGGANEVLPLSIAATGLVVEDEGYE